MTINDFSEMATTLLAISLASERIVTLAKTIYPSLLSTDKSTLDENGKVNIKPDQTRRLTVIAISFVSAWITASFLADKPGWFGWSFFGTVIFGKDHPTDFPVWIVGLLSSGGSAFWGNILDYTKSVKDIQTQRKAAETLALKTTQPASNAQSQKDASRTSKPLADIVSDLNSKPQPSLDLNQSRVKRPQQQ